MARFISINGDMIHCDLACPACDTPEMFPQGFFKRTECLACKTIFRAGIDGLREAVKDATVQVSSRSKPHKKIIPLGFSLFTPEEQADQRPKCSFCGVVVDSTNMTLGTSKPRMFTRDKLTRVNGIIVKAEQEITHVVDKLRSCPACVLNIQPVIDKSGKIVNQGIKFPETDG